MTELERIEHMIAITSWECIFGTGDDRMREAHHALLERRHRILGRPCGPASATIKEEHGASTDGDMSRCGLLYDDAGRPRLESRTQGDDHAYTIVDADGQVRTIVGAGTVLVTDGIGGLRILSAGDEASR